MFFLEFILIAALLAAFFLYPPFKSWLHSIGKRECIIGGAVLAVLVAGHLSNSCRNTFPFVRWAMYSEYYEPEQMEWGKIQGVTASGKVVWVNPAEQFPSLSRNFFERISALVRSTRRGTLTAAGEIVLDDMLETFAANYNKRNQLDPLVEIRLVLQTITVENRQSQTQDEVVYQKVVELNRDELIVKRGER